jgi:uncharacterized SAM-binding protein YcdF (DUF218 family)
MIRKSVIALALLAATTLSGCVVYSPRPVAYAPAVYSPAVVVAPVVPVWGFWGWGWHGGGRWR